jgi:hypothetical protein
MQDLLHVLRASGVVVATMSGHTHNNGYVLDEVCKIVTCIRFPLKYSWLKTTISCLSHRLSCTD